ncbi:Dipeptidyl-peptidase 7 [termite gut metagenome]|uniref:Dipeptidyl-peptidase 7 n=1 Tax=termite gut metagenome TaxID=433724 RepID=A0A5J4QM14_9ZZZZ
MKRLPFIILLFTCVSVCADEGMWMLTDLKRQNEAVMMELGLEIPVNQIYSSDSIALKDAVVHFGSGCTGEVISAEGLVLTNHHCGYGSIQRLSSVEHDYLTDGFWAMTRGGELPCKGVTVTFIDRILDVTDYVKEQLKKDDDPQGVNYLSPRYLSTVAIRFAQEENINITPATVLELKPFYGGNKHYLFIKLVYGDIRMVGTPPSSIGKFGADTDNWMWPRHAGDFSLFRIYADSLGNPAEYSPNNIPLKVKKHLTISLDGMHEGDFAFIIGFPGRNFRYMISDEVEERMQTVNFMRHHVREARQKVLAEQMEKGPAVRIHYASKYASSANYWKNAIGMNEGLIRLKVLDTKRKQQEQLLARGREKGDDSYQKAFDEIRSIVLQRSDVVYHQQAIGETLVTALDFMRIPSVIGLADALKAKNKEGIEKETERLRKEAEEYFASVPFPEVERLVAQEMLQTYARYIPKEQRISIFHAIDKQFKGNNNAFINACFNSSIFGSKENFEKFIKHPSIGKIEKDWMVLFKNSINNDLQQISAITEKTDAGYNAAHKAWVKGMTDMKQENGIPVYPDANSTMRLTYGKVLSYQPADGQVFKYYTTLRGVMEKEDASNHEFIVPAKLKQLYENKDFGKYVGANGEMPVCFIVDTDNTGGNSGSPVFNGKGQLIGTAFDRNYEGLTGDIAFRPSQRAACVDIRYTLFIIDKYAGASHIIKELTIASDGCGCK